MNQEPLPEKKRRLNLLSRISLYLGIAAILVSALLSISHYINWGILPGEAIGPHPWLGVLVFVLLYIIFFVGLPVFLICLVSIIVSVFKKPRLINFAVSFIGLFLFFISVEVFVVTIEWSRLAPVRFFPSNLRQIGFALEKCAKKNKGNLPSAANWYDSLLKCDPIKYAFRNDGQKHDDGLSEFAFNANISGLKLVELPKNTVLIFETLLAKNPAGGPELMSTNNHPIKGCFVLFTDMHIAFVRAEDFNNLRWKP